jgi:hypothetical protein
MNPLTLVRSWRKHLADLEADDVQGFPNKEISKSETLNMVCAMRSFENINEETLKNGYSDACEMSFQHNNAAAKQKGEEQGREDHSKTCTAMRRSINSSQKQAIMTNYFSKQCQL